MNLGSGVLLGLDFAGQVPVVRYTRLGGDRPHCHRHVLEGTAGVGNVDNSYSVYT